MRAMYTRQELSKILGLSYKQLRTRLAHLAQEGNLLEGQVVKGSNGRLEYKPVVIELLRNLEPLAQAPGKGNREAAQELAADIHGNKVADGQSEAGKAGNQGNEWASVLIEELRGRIRDLQHERDTWKDLALNYQAQIPPPKPERSPRRWFAWLRPSVVKG